MGTTERKTSRFAYTFAFADGSERRFDVVLDFETLGMICEERTELPDWTRLEFRQCPNCPLNPAEHPRCPVAVNLVDLIECFRTSTSFDEVDVTVESKNRKYVAHTALQKGIGALVGLVMVTSGCPILNRLRPMVDTHLPFMTLEESTYRIISMYLTAQYFVHKTGGEPDWELKGLLQFLKETHAVNSAFSERLRAIRIRDASLNAVVNLNTSSDFISIAVQTNWLARFEKIFLEHAGWDEKK